MIIFRPHPYSNMVFKNASDQNIKVTQQVFSRVQNVLLILAARVKGLYFFIYIFSCALKIHMGLQS